MTLTPSAVRKRVGSHAHTLDDLADRLALAVRNATLAAEDPQSLDERPRPENATGVQVSGHGDPTAAQALAGMRTFEVVFELFESDLEVLQVCVARLVQFAERWAPVVVDHPRCNAGRDSVQPWARPDCTQPVAYSVRNDGTISYRPDGLCDSCRMRKHRHDKQRDDAA